MFCKICNAENQDGAAFCTNCGAALEQETVAQEVTYPEMQNADYNPEFAAAAEAEMVPAEDPGKMLNIVSLILGIAALVLGTVCSCIMACLGGILPFGLAVGAIITGFLGMKKSKDAGFNNKLGLIGMILGIVAVVIIGIFIIVNAIIGGAMAMDMSNSSYYF